MKEISLRVKAVAVVLTLVFALLGTAGTAMAGGYEKAPASSNVVVQIGCVAYEARGCGFGTSVNVVVIGNVEFGYRATA